MLRKTLKTTLINLSKKYAEKGDWRKAIWFLDKSTIFATKEERMKLMKLIIEFVSSERKKYGLSV